MCCSNDRNGIDIISDVSSHQLILSLWFTSCKWYVYIEVSVFFETVASGVYQYEEHHSLVDWQLVGDHEMLIFPDSFKRDHNIIIIIIITIIIIIKDNVYGAVIVTNSHCESSPGSS